MADLVYYAVAIVIAFAALAVGIAALAIPIAILAWLARGSPSTPPTKSVTDEVVKAQWEFDRLWKRRK